MSVTDINAMRKWNKVPKDLQQRLIRNVFCRNCYETSIIDYTLNDHELGVLLKGKCKTCGDPVARLVEDIE